MISLGSKQLLLTHVLGHAATLLLRYEFRSLRRRCWCHVAGEGGHGGHNIGEWVYAEMLLKSVPKSISKRCCCRWLWLLLSLSSIRRRLGSWLCTKTKDRYEALHSNRCWICRCLCWTSWGVIGLKRCVLVTKARICWYMMWHPKGVCCRSWWWCWWCWRC